MKSLKKYDIVSIRSITSWDEAIPLGNGKLGSLVYGEGKPLKISVDRVDLWDERLHPNTLEKDFNYKKLVALSRSNLNADWAERERLFEMRPSKAYPTKLTAGSLELYFSKNTENIKTRLSLEKGIASINLDEGKTGKIEIFLSAIKFIGVAKIWGEYALDIHVPNYFSGEGEIDETQCLHYPPAKVLKEENFIYYVQNTLEDFAFGIVALCKKYNGYSEIYYTIATSQDSSDFITEAKKELIKSAEFGYDALKKEHTAWWQQYWGRSEIAVSDELIEKTYYRSYYLFASCSRKGFYPMPLQGVWTADNDCLPPWRGDYHHDTITDKNSVGKQAIYQYLVDIETRGQKNYSKLYNRPVIGINFAYTAEELAELKTQGFKKFSFTFMMKTDDEAGRQVRTLRILSGLDTNSEVLQLPNATYTEKAASMNEWITVEFDIETVISWLAYIDATGINLNEYQNNLSYTTEFFEAIKGIHSLIQMNNGTAGNAGLLVSNYTVYVAECAFMK